MITEGYPRERAFAVALVLYAIVICATVWRARPPAARPANAPADEFSGARAKEMLAQLVGNGVPHPVGSAADGTLREKIVARLTELGYQPRVQESFVCDETGRCADVKNILARLDGQEPGPAVMLSSHYDSVPAGPGASDDGAGTVCVLEIARALKASPPLRHSAIFLIDEGEEEGLFGAVAFVQDDPWAKDVRAVVNMDNRGTSGPATMFETASANEWAVRLYGKAIRHPDTNSLSYTVYKRLPNDTDFTVFKRAGYQGLNFAFIGGVARYHTPLDNVANANAASIQEEGQDGLEAARALANSDLKFGAPSEAVYADLFGWKTIWWPARWTTGFALIALVLLSFEIVTLAGRRQMRVREFLLGLAIWPLILIAGGVFGAVLEFVLHIAGAMPANWVAHPLPMLFATWALGFLAAVLAGAFFSRRAGFWGMWSGVWIWWGVAALVLGMLAPGLDFIFVASALAAAIFGLGILLTGREGAASAGAIAAIVPAFVTALFGVYSDWSLYTALGGAFLAGITVCVALIAVPLAPLAATIERGRWAVSAGVFAIAVAATAAALFVPPFSKSSPEQMNIEYQQNGDTGKSQWVVNASGRRLPLGMRSVMPFGRTQSAMFPWDRSKPFAAPAPGLNLPAPTLAVRQVSHSGGKLIYQVLLKSERGAPVIIIAFAPDTALESVQIHGHAVPQLSERMLYYTRGWKIYGCVDSPPEGIEMQFALRDEKRTSAFLFDESYGLPAQGTALALARPVMATPIQNGDSTVVAKRVTLAPQ